MGGWVWVRASKGEGEGGSEQIVRVGLGRGGAPDWRGRKQTKS